jgi:3-oxoacyl-[acyl-carrier protein] reductase
VIDGSVVFGAIAETDTGKAIQAVLRDIGASFSTAAEGVASSELRPKALVFDATGVTSSADLNLVAALLLPRDPAARTGRPVIVVGRTPELADTPPAQIAQTGHRGLTRSLGKEVRRGATVNLVYVAPDAADQLDSTLRFLLSPKSAYVSGQVIRIGRGPVVRNDPAAPLAGKVALVTGAARGIGASIVEVLARDGATVVGVDVPQNANQLRQVMAPVAGSELLLDVTAIDAPQRIAAHAREHHGGLDIVVHNAGITRDKRLANMRTDAWDAVLDVNLRAPERITAQLIESGVLHDGGSVVGVASIAGYRREQRPDQLRDLEGRGDRAGRGPRAGPGGPADRINAVAPGSSRPR